MTDVVCFLIWLLVCIVLFAVILLVVFYVVEMVVSFVSDTLKPFRKKGKVPAANDECICAGQGEFERVMISSSDFSLLVPALEFVMNRLSCSGIDSFTIDAESRCLVFCENGGEGAYTKYPFTVTPELLAGHITTWINELPAEDRRFFNVLPSGTEEYAENGWCIFKPDCYRDGVCGIGDYEEGETLLAVRPVRIEFGK